LHALDHPPLGRTKAEFASVQQARSHTMPKFHIFALTLPGQPDPAIAIAATRAGGAGVLDLEYTRDMELAVDSMQRLVRYAKGECGIKLDGSDSKFCHAVLAAMPAGIQAVLLTFGDPRAMQRQVAALHRRKLRVLLEITSQEQAMHGQAIGVDGLIAKGHEAGGRVAEETTYILLQHLLTRSALPVYAQGGVGLHTAAACYAAGAAGVILDWQLALSKESPLSAAVKAKLEHLDGSETVCLGTALGHSYRIYARPGLAAVARAQEAERALAGDASLRPQDVAARWRESIRPDVGCHSAEANLLLMGQDAAFAEPLGKRFVSVGGIIQGVRQAIDAHCRAAKRLRPLDEASALAESHGTRYPVIQGAMTRVSDNAEFARAVADGGALPFLALALMRKADVEPLLAETKARLGDRPWGVGILGFVPLELRQEQMEAIRAYRPPFALIAGGRPDQARALEKDGIATYLHVPSPRLLEMFLQDGATRFVFEGRECGGHVGPRTSFVLWEQMTEEILRFLSANGRLEANAYHVLFAGGIHDALSAAMVAAMAAPLAEAGVRIGISMGTGYIFTQEAVSTGAIVRAFQEEALKSQVTVLFETGPGHAIRCADTPYRALFNQEKQRLYTEGKSFEEVRVTLEFMNLGRLRIASKGIAQNPEYRRDPQAPRFVAVTEAEQNRQGMYMIGQVAGLRHEVCTIEELHRSVTIEASDRTDMLEPLDVPAGGAEDTRPPSDVAIVGMACLLPKAPNLQTYWENILNKVDAITEIPKERWDWELYYDANRLARDKIYSKWGGFLDEVPFDPLQYGIPPNSLRSIEPLHLLTLEVVRAALKDAGYLDRPFPRERTSVILGAGGGADLGGRYGFRSMLPYFLHNAANASGEREKIVHELSEVLPEWTEDSFAGILTNVAAGRVANRFDLGGRNFTVDAACAASLAAVDLAVRELEEGSSDMVVVGGADTMQNPFAYLCFSKTHALSPRGRCHTFDDSSDGIAISEGIAVIILKRLADAERDGDRIYAVIKGVGGSSDGKDKGLTAPRPEGQMRALTRAYAKAHVSPASVELIEAHGTGTAVGDQAEVASLSQVFSAAGAARQSCAIGSVKSMIGHTKCTAGVASVIKIALALHHRVLPPTINVEKPNTRANFPATPFYVNTEARPWIRQHEATPRRAGVSAFGFGGTNFHAVLEEYTGDYQGDAARHASARWPSELFLWKGQSRQALVDAIAPFEKALASSTTEVALAHLAYTAYESYSQPLTGDGAQLQLAVVATSVQDLREKLSRAREALTDQHNSQTFDPRGVYFTAQPMALEGKVAFLFPGQGSQQPNMLKDLTLQFPTLRTSLEQANSALRGTLERALSSYIFPPPTFTQEEEAAAKAALTDTRIAQPALGALEAGLFHLLSSLGVRPDFLAGHSYGEYVALYAAGVLSSEDFMRLSEARGRFILEGAGEDPGTMAAVECDALTVEGLISDIADVVIANFNSPSQTIISGRRAAVETAVTQLSAQGKRARLIPVACAFHSPLMAPAQEPLGRFLTTLKLSVPQMLIFSNTTAAAYPRTPKAIARLLVEHLVQPVKFLPQVEALYEAGARIFVEVGPGAVLTNRVGEILAERPHLRVAADQPGRSSLAQLQHLLGQLATHGVPVQLDPLFAGRGVERIDLTALDATTNGGARSPLTWLVNGTRAKPLNEPEVPKSNPTAAELEVPGGAQANASTDTAQPRRLAPRRIAAASPTPLAAAKVVTPASGSGSVSLAAQQGVGDPTPGNGGSLIPPLPSSPSPVLPPRQPLAGREPLPVATQVTSPHEMVQVMNGYQELMRQFLETQKSVMQAFFQGATNATAPMATAQVSFPPQHEGGSAPIRFPDLPALEAIGTDNTMRDGHVPIQGLSALQEALLLPQTERPDPMPQEPEVWIPSAGDEEGASTSLVPTADSSLAVGLDIPGKEELTARLIAIVSERTGYPAEMLDLDLDLEADLGIDSIKRIEILGNYQKSFDFTAEEDIAVIMEELAKIKTLRGVIEWVDTRLRGVVAGQPTDVGRQAQTPEHLDAEVWGEIEPLMLPEASVQVEAAATDTPVAMVQRYTLEAAERPLGAGSDLIRLAAGRVVVLTDDERGVAESLATALREQGHAVALVRMGEHTTALADGLYRGDLSSPSTVRDLLQLIRQRQGPVTGLVHLLPLRHGGASESTDQPDAYGRIETEVKSLFHLTQEVSQDLKEAAPQGGAWVVAVTDMGGGFGHLPADDGAAFFPGQGGIAGFVKTVAREWPAVRAKVIDTDALTSPAALATMVLQEMRSGDGEVEVGYQSARRLVLQPRLNPLQRGGAPALKIASDWVILVTGGARGITADVARELAEQYRPTLLLVGRTPLPPPHESSDTLALISPKELKAAIMEQMRAVGEAITPARVESAYNQLLKDREIRRNLDAMRSAGARVHYYQVDVREEQAFGALIETIYRDHGRLDGVIHGAGIIEDKFIEDKTPESFDRVFDTKVCSAFLLSRRLKLDELSFLVFFSSMSGRFGNRGQCDYAAANEVLNKLALSLDRRSPGRVVSVNWGPWESGMVSPELRRQFTQHGVVIIPRAIGRQSLDQELCWGRKGEVEVLLGGIEAGSVAMPQTAETSPVERHLGFPLLSTGANLSRLADGSLELVRTLDPTYDLYLNDHRLDGKPVFPMAMALELMAEAAAAGWPDLHVVEMKDLRLLRGLVLDHRSQAVRVVAKPAGSPSRAGTEVEVSIAGISPHSPLYYKAIARMAPALPPPPRLDDFALSDVKTLPLSLEDVYRQWLFHGPLMAGIGEIKGVGGNGITGHLIPSSPEKCLGSNAAGAWLIDPVVLDSALQLIIVWTRVHWDMTPLPARMQSYKRFGALTSHLINCQMRIEPDPAGHIVHTYVAFYGDDGQLLGLVEDAEGVCSKALNRLAQMKDNPESRYMHELS
jgi:acyl transferase domain-containing protein/NAD(P)H-dependent flavin oxidoreductase YrpB (nitropropane dioxygenase family)/NAD(P)-dependent dehydrogenase (short-subunit alcohol dehydrogenase family)/acyl carrier protein